MLVRYQPIFLPPNPCKPLIYPDHLPGFPCSSGGNCCLSSIPPGSWLAGYSMGSWKKEPGLRHWVLKSSLVKTCNPSSFFWVKQVTLVMKWRPLKQNIRVLALFKNSYFSWNIVNWLEKSQSRSFLAITLNHCAAFCGLGSPKGIFVQNCTNSQEQNCRVWSCRVCSSPGSYPLCFLINICSAKRKEDWT